MVAAIRGICRCVPLEKVAAAELHPHDTPSRGCGIELQGQDEKVVQSSVASLALQGGANPGARNIPSASGALKKSQSGNFLIKSWNVSIRSQSDTRDISLSDIESDLETGPAALGETGAEDAGGVFGKGLGCIENDCPVKRQAKATVKNGRG